jgi:hypothetical protein
MYIIYTNYFEFNNRIFSYRKKILFDITETPKALFCSNNRGFWGYWIDREWLNENSISGFIIKKEYKKEVSKEYLFIIEQLDKVIK